MLRAAVGVIAVWVSVAPALGLDRHGRWAAKFAQGPKMRLAAATFFGWKGVRLVKAGKVTTSDGHDVRMLRDFAKRYAEVAHKPIQDERRDLWRKHNSLVRTRPLIYVRWLAAWHEAPESRLECHDPFFQGYERFFRQMLFQDTIGDDYIIEPWVTVRASLVFILTDDQGYGDLACYGATDLNTPVADGLAAEGVRFTQYYAAAPECTPTRTAFMTGRYLQRVGGLECAIGTTNVGRYDDAISLAERHELGLPVEETSIATLLDRPGRERRPLEGRPAEARRLKVLLADWERRVRHTRGRQT